MTSKRIKPFELDEIISKFNLLLGVKILSIYSTSPII